MKQFLVLVFGVILGCSASGYYFTHNINKASTTEIDVSITKYEERVTALDKEISRFSGGLYPALLSAQKAVYQDIVAALELKKVEAMHWVVFIFQPQTVQPVYGSGESANIEKEMEQLKVKIDSGKNESARYSPCLVKSLIDTRVAQEELTLSGLERALIGKKYSIPMFSNGSVASSGQENQQKEKIANPEEDKNAL